jgi:hypothetical protein
LTPRSSADGSSEMTSARTVSSPIVPPSPTHSQCHGSAQRCPGPAQPGWFHPTRAAWLRRNR